MQTVVELATYLRKAEKLFTEEERSKIVTMLAIDPACGDLIVGTGGFRKVRFGVAGRGKSGGARVIYFLRNADTPVYIITVYAKNEKASLTDKEKKLLRKAAAELTKEHP